MTIRSQGDEVQVEVMTPGVPALPRGGAIVPTCAPIQALYHAVVDAVTGGALWSDQNGEAPPAYRRSIAGGTVYVCISPHGTAEFSPSTLPMLWCLARSISWETLVVAQALLAQYATLTTAADQAVIISVDQILDYRGLRRIKRAGEPHGWHHGHRTQDRLEVAREIAVLQQIHFSAFNIRSYARMGRGRASSTLSFQDSHLIAVTDTWGEIKLAGDGTEAYPTHIRYILGAWMREYEKAGLKQLGRFLNQNLSYDPYRQSWELAMSSWLSLEVFPNNTGGGCVIHRGIDRILSSIGQKPDQRHPDRMRRRFETMMNRMVADGYLSKWAYVGDHNWTAKHWQATWLKARVSLTPSKSFEDYYSDRNPRRGRRGTADKRRPSAKSRK